jgi:hypothetical protein
MKKIFTFALILFAFASQITAQDSLTEQSAPAAKPQRNKDRLMFSTYNCFWQGLPTGVTQRTISQGYNLSLMFDMPTSEKSKISFGLGLGYTRNHLYSNAITKQDFTARTTVMNPIADGIKYNTNKLTFTYINIPLEVRFRSAQNFRFAFGLRSSLLVDSYSKYFGHNPDTTFYGQNGQLKIINKDISNTEKYAFELTARIGWKFVTLNGSYMLNKAFKADKGPQIGGYTLGVTLSAW